MTRLPVPSLLATIDLFTELPEAVRRDIADRGDMVTFRPGCAVVEQGLPGAGLCLVLDGSADVEVDGQRVDSLFEGDYFGEISLLDGASRSAGVRAGSRGLRAWRVSAPAFAPLMDQPEVARMLLTALCARVRRAEAAAPSTG
jgi:CRP-like cAMP-binding protein